MQILRTPDERFADLPGYSFEPHYAQLGEIRVHYLDQGPRDASPVLMLHGEPSWSYLYRKMIPIIAGAGHRVVAPDLVGFGRSDKPAAREDYTYQRHVDWMSELLFEKLDLRDITLVCQDWGGLIGLRLVAENSDRFARVVAANTLLPTGDPAAPANRAAWEALLRFEKTAFSDGDPITAAYEPILCKIQGCEGQPHTTIENGGHFLQEDQGEELARVVNDFIARTRAE